jgi:trehalose 6-phosphate synthase
VIAEDIVPAGPRLVAVSNRVGPIKGVHAAGGLAVAVVGALQRRGGMWFGWSGQTVDKSPEQHEQALGRIKSHTIDLLKADYDAYYGGYANRCLWPVCHFRPDLIEYELRYREGYDRVNREFAQRLAPLLKPDDLVWVHDFHLIPLGQRLREKNIRNAIGFFLHVPLPPPPLLATLPGHETLMKSLFAYDVVGFQTETDRRAFADYVTTRLGGTVSADGRMHWDGHTVVCHAYPVGIDAHEFEMLAQRAEVDVKRMRTALLGRKQIIGVDRLDYSKGLLRRMAGFDALLDSHAEHRGHVEYLQIAPISRGELGSYRSFRGELDQWAARINGRYADVDWTPVRYLNKTISRRSLAGLYRASRVGLVTPVRDGMNLVAKEYVAAQDPRDPGVLIVSEFAGAVHQMTAALQVNPYDATAMGAALNEALVMRREERIARHAELLRNVRREDVTHWAETFLDDLKAVRAAVPVRAVRGGAVSLRRAK